MYGAVQSGGQSPKPLNGPSGTQQLRPGSESVQNSPSPLTSQVKGKKRDRTDQVADLAKRERVSRAEDTDSGQWRAENLLRSEIAKITDKGGLVSFEGVERLVQLMRPDNADKKIDLASRIMLADVIAVTDSYDCLGWFVKLMGLPVLDEWLQEVHKGKIGDGSSPRESEKSVDEFLLVLLHALDKLPVNLQALQTCNVGKSVNHLRSHKNSEIQRKARSLVDTWKKRVEAEMNIMDAKSGSSHGGSWPSKSVLSEASHVGNRRNGGPSEVSLKSSSVQSSAYKSPSVKIGSGEVVAKIASPSSSITKSAVPMISSAAVCAKDHSSTMSAGGGSLDVPLPTIKEEKSSSSSQSQNNSQSCSSDHAKTGVSCREDVRSSAGSVSVSKISGSVSRHRKSGSGLQGSSVSGIQKETTSVKHGSSRNMASEKASPTRGAYEKVSPTRGAYERIPDVPHADHGNSQRLIVRLPNSGRSPARSANGSSSEDPTSTLIRSSALTQSDKLNHDDRKVKGKTDALQASGAPSVNLNSGQGRDGLFRSEGKASSPDVPCNEGSRGGEDGEKLTELSKSSTSPSGIVIKSGKSYDMSFSSMNALIESCAKLSEASTTSLGGDDAGMNLLASVAAGEMSRSDNSTLGSPGRKSPGPEDSCSENDIKLRHLDGDTAQSKDLPDVWPNGGARAELSDQLGGGSKLQNDTMTLSANFSGEGKFTLYEDKMRGCIGQPSSCRVDLQQDVCGSSLKSDGKPGPVNDASMTISSEDAVKEEKVEVEGACQLHAFEKADVVQVRISNLSTSEPKTMSPLSNEENKVGDADVKNVGSTVVMSAKPEKEANEESPSCLPSDICGECKNAVDKESDSDNQKPIITSNIHLDTVSGKGEITALPSDPVDVCKESKSDMSTDGKATEQTEVSEKPNIVLSYSMLDRNEEHVRDSKIKEVHNQCSDGLSSHKEPAVGPVKQTVQCMKPIEDKLEGLEAGGTGECAFSVAGTKGPAAGQDAALKLDFDLNEGYPCDDGCSGELAKPSVPGNLSTVSLPSALSFPVSTMSGCSPSITVASPAKGAFFPPENPLRSKGELGWKGSAATSAFRPAEPRKALEMSLSKGEFPPVDNVVTKQGRTWLDIDLNVPDQRVFEDVACQNSAQETLSERRPIGRHGGGLDLDLNWVDESPDAGQSSISNSSKLEIPQFSSRPSLSSGFSNTELNASRGFDLNNGPGPDDGATETASCGKGNVPFLSPLTGIRMNTADQGNLSSWFPPSSSYSAIGIPPILPGRGDQSYPLVPATGMPRMLGGPSGTSFSPELYRGQVLSSAPAIQFPPAAPFQYTGFPFETNFPLSSTMYSGGSAAYMESSSGGPVCFPAIPSQLMGPSGVASTHFPRPYVMNLTGGTNNVGPDTRKWGAQVLDLNTGPGSTDVDRREERLPSALRQLSVAGSQTHMDEQIKLYQMAGGVLKRKEPEGGRDGDRISYHQPSWQ
ncbi:hypothetical protein NMG60_11028345 [Bertholletia excelsa]